MDGDILLILKAFLIVFAAIFFMKIFQYNRSLIFISLLILLLLIYFTDPDVPIMFLLAAGFGGAIIELIVINCTDNIWVYKDPDILKIPLWLILLWAIAAYIVLLMYKITDKYFRLESKVS